MRLSYKTFLQRGLAAGAIGGLCTALFIRLVTETQIGKAINFEDFSHLGSPPGEAAMFARSTQHWGGMLAAIIFGTAVGAMFSVAVAGSPPRSRPGGVWGAATRSPAPAWVATAPTRGQTSPPNPPTVGDPDTINQRTFWYMLLLAVSVILVVLTFRLWERTTARGLVGAPRFAAVAGTFLVALSLIWVFFPKSPDPIEPPDNDAKPALQIADDAPAVVLDQVLEVGRQTGSESIRNPKDTSLPLDLDTVDKGTDLRGLPVAISTTKLRPDVYTTMVWHFRTQTFAGLALLWLVTGTLMGYLLDRKVAQDAEPSTEWTPEPVSV